MFKTAEYQRGYDAGYRQALLDALAQQGVSARVVEPPQRRVGENGR